MCVAFSSTLGQVYCTEERYNLVLGIVGLYKLYINILSKFLIPSISQQGLNHGPYVKILCRVQK
jgi:hypothetical protein